MGGVGCVGSIVGTCVGSIVGSSIGSDVGSTVGFPVGIKVVIVGLLDGALLGCVGIGVGLSVLYVQICVADAAHIASHWVSQQKSSSAQIFDSHKRSIEHPLSVNIFVHEQHGDFACDLQILLAAETHVLSHSV